MISRTAALLALILALALSIGGARAQTDFHPTPGNGSAPGMVPLCPDSNGDGKFSPCGTSAATGAAPYGYTDLGSCQIPVSNSAIGLTGGTGVCSSSIPTGATVAVITVEGNPIRWTGTGATNPASQTFGTLQNTGQFTYSASLSSFRMNDTSAGSATVDVEFFR